MLRSEVTEAFDGLLREIDKTVEALRKEGMDALSGGSFAAVREVSQQAERLTEMRAKVMELLRDWGRILTGRAVDARRRRPAKAVSSERLRRGLRTPERVFRVPILRTLVEFGGAAQVSKVLDRLTASMKDVLNDHDRQPLPSDPAQIRWRNTVAWCRNDLAREGLLAADSPRGVWAITPAGRDELKRVSGQDEV